MSNIYIQEEYVQVEDDKRYGLGSSAVYETFTDNVGELFRSLQKDFGRCRAKVYVDRSHGLGANTTHSQHVGWIFEKRVPYQDAPKTYLQEVWVTLHEDLPTKWLTYKYHDMGEGP